MSVTPPIQSKTDGETRNVAVDFTAKLDSGELLTGTPTVTDASGDLTITNKAVNAEQLTINNKTVAVGKAVQFQVSGGSVGNNYPIVISVGTDSTPAQTLVEIVTIRVTAD